MKLIKKLFKWIDNKVKTFLYKRKQKKFLRRKVKNVGKKDPFIYK